jgi:hypothetical protein
MPVVRSAVSVLTGVLLAALAGCGGSSRQPAHEASPPPPTASTTAVDHAGATTLAEGAARFTLAVSGEVGGLGMRADERGAIAFVRPRAHIYKLLLSGGIPEEVIVDGPYVYSNGNVQAAMNDTTVKPWTKLDTRRLTARERQSNGDELAHVRAPAYLIEGVAHLRRVGVGSGGVVHVQGMVDPTRLAAYVPISIRASILATVARDYARTPFPADFWIDPKGRVRRVHVSYGTGSSGRIVVTATYSDFGAPVALGLPPSSHTQDITP